MSNKNLTTGSFWTAVGIGIIAAPFTGGMSLAYAATTIAVAGAVDKSKELSTDGAVQGPKCPPMYGPVAPNEVTF